MLGCRSRARGVVATATCWRSWRISDSQFERARRRLAGRRRQRERERAALADLALDPDLPAVMLDDLAADRQAEAGALRLVGEGVADLLEPLEHLRLVRRRDAHAGVDDAHDERAVLLHGAAGDRCPCR